MEPMVLLFTLQESPLLADFPFFTAKKSMNTMERIKG
jgi:hypothetical protein